MLTIWGRLNSHNVKKVAWFAAELGIEHIRHDVGGAYGMDADYLAKNPNALIPTIEDGDLILWESNAILRYLAAQYGGEVYWPADPAKRAQADKWMDWQFTFAGAQHHAFINLIRTPANQRDLTSITKSAKNCAGKMTLLNEALQVSPWLSGDMFGIGDIPMGVYAYTWFTLDIERPALPHVEAWYARLRERTAYASQVMIPLT